MAADSASASKSSQAEGNVKETIESILVAFILAFVFRAFVVEAFVIPTGSMGPTLMGAHMRFDCPDCGYHFAVNFPTKEGDGTDIPAASWRRDDVTCPNCGYVFPRDTSTSSQQTPVYFGDRILVLKYRYLFRDPKRWDVVVFKSPYERNRDPSDPKYIDNYIKRLVGNPNESLMVLDGDVYVGAFNEKDPLKLTIQRKPDYVQNALWRIVYDNDYLPRGIDRGTSNRPWRQPWVIEDGKGWTGPRAGDDGKTGHDRIFRFSNNAGDGSIAFDPEADPETHSMTDWLGYNQSSSTLFPVQDLKLSCVYTRTDGSGPLRLQLTKRDDCFTAELTPGHVTLLRHKIAQRNPLRLESQPMWKLDQAVPELKQGEPVRVELVNLDYRVSVRVDGRVVLSTTDAQYSPDISALVTEYRQHPNYPNPDAPRAMARIEAANQTSSLEHVSLWRDIYYLNNGTNRLTPSGAPGAGRFWSSPDNIVQLGPDEFFVMGDNAQVSLDARWWGAPVDLPAEDIRVDAGRVPRGFMLGKAFFVYWPAGYRPLNLPYGIEPDFGDMRFIH